MPNYIKSSSSFGSGLVKNREEKSSLTGSRKFSVQSLPPQVVSQGKTSSELPKRGSMLKSRIFRVVVGVALAAGLGALIGGPAGVIVGGVVGATYIIVGPQKIWEVLDKSARAVARHITDGISNLSNKPDQSQGCGSTA